MWRLFGFVQIKFKSLLNDCNVTENRIILDCRNIDIIDVENLTSDKKLSWNLFKGHEAANSLGTPLVIILDNNDYKLNDEFTLKINYSTTKDSEGLLWLNSNQTNLKQYPFMFTQSEPILGRTIFPCQVNFFKSLLKIKGNKFF